MKFKILPCLMAAALCSCGSAEGEKEMKTYSNEVQVVVILGQSNAEGHSWVQYLPKTVGEERAQKFNNGIENVKISYNLMNGARTSEGNFVPVKTGQGNTEEKFGLELGIAETIGNVDPTKPVYLIKYAYGGTNLYSNWRSKTSKNTGYLYNGAVAYVLEQCKKLEEMDLFPTINAICWMQGEDDSNSPSYGEYETLERNFKNDLRNDFSYYKPLKKEIGFVDGYISDSPARQHYVEINNAKLNLSKEDENHVIIDSIAENLKYNAEPLGGPDIYHFDSGSEVKLGNLFAEKIIANFIDID